MFGVCSFSVKISNLFICFCSFDLPCPILEKDNFIENVCIVLSCLIKLRSLLNLFVSILLLLLFSKINKYSAGFILIVFRILNNLSFFYFVFSVSYINFLFMFGVYLLLTK